MGLRLYYRFRARGWGYTPWCSRTGCTAGRQTGLAPSAPLLGLGHHDWAVPAAGWVSPSAQTTADTATVTLCLDTCLCHWILSKHVPTGAPAQPRRPLLPHEFPHLPESPALQRLRQESNCELQARINQTANYVEASVASEWVYSTLAGGHI